MFDGMADQFYQILAAAAATSRATTTTATASATTANHDHNHHHVVATLPISFSLTQNHHAANTFPIQQSSVPSVPFDASFLLNNHPQLPLHIQQQTRNDARKEDSTSVVQAGTETSSSTSLIMQETGIDDNVIPWSNEEVLALLKIRSSMDNTWFPPHDFTWENVSRKLGEIGFKRSAQKCKEKFEEETRSFNNNTSHNNNVINTCNNNNNKINIGHNYRLFGELEELYSCNNATNIDDHHGGKVDDPIDNDDGDGDGDPLLSSGEQSWDDAHDALSQEKVVGNDKNTPVQDDGDEEEQSVGDDSEKTEENTKKVRGKRKRKRKRQQNKYEMFKGFCEKIVNKMMAQQEELHCKILQDMVKRDEEKLAREETWKSQHIHRISKEMQLRAHHHTLLGDRQAKILHFLNNFSSSSSSNIHLDTQSLRDTLENLMIKLPKSSFAHNNNNNNSSILSLDSITPSQPTSSCSTPDQNQNPTCLAIPTSSSNENLAPQSCNILNNSNLTQPTSLSPLNQTLQNPNPHHVGQNESLVGSIPTNKSFGSDHTSIEAKHRVSKTSVVGSVKDDPGRRWPRDEVLALINIRCNLFSNNSNNGDHHDRDISFSKGPLWERISQKMLELGYKRSAKRCKEKWENINKYFRKTKDLNKKRSVDSRTCPYFYQLSHLYNQGQGGAVHGSSDRAANAVGSPENQPAVELPGAQGGSNNGSNVATTTTVHASTQVLNEGTVVQVPGFDFEF